MRILRKTLHCFYPLLILLHISPSFAGDNKGCPTDGSYGNFCETLKSVDKNTPPSKLCVLNTEGFEPVWYLWSGYGLPQRLETVPDTMMQVTSMMISPSQQFLAVESVGEGHPYITVVELAPLLNQIPTKTKVEINPFPGTANLVKWEQTGTQERLMVGSDRLLTDNNQDLYDENQSFAVVMPTGKIQAVSSTLQQPISYYVNWLQRVDANQTSTSAEEIMETLASLVNTTERRQLLQQSLAKESNSTVKAQLAKVLEKSKLEKPKSD